MIKKISLILICLTFVFACSKEEKSEPAAPAAVVNKTAELSSSLNRLPENTVGFVYVDLAGKAMKKLMDSPWGKAGTTKYVDQMLEQDGIDSVISTMKAGGLNLDDPSSLAKKFSEIVIFGGKDHTGGYFTAAEASASDTLKVLVDSARKKEGVSVEEQKIGNYDGFILTNQTESGETVTLYLAANKELGAISDSSETVLSVLDGKSDSLPASLSKDKIVEATKSRFDSADVMMVGYLDGEAVDKFSEEQDFPVTEASFVYGMSEGPGFDVNVSYEKEAVESKNKMLADVKGSSSETVFTALPDKPLFMVSLDGNAIKSALEASGEESAGAQLEAAKEFINTIKRVAVSAKPGAGGQASFLPIPELVLSLQTTNAAEVRDNIKSLVQAGLQGSGMPPMTWSVNKEGDTDVHVMDSGMGVGVYLAAKDDVVLLASTGAQLTSSLKSLSGEAESFEKNLSKTERTDLGVSDSVMSLKLDFDQLASYLESSKGTLQMYVSPEDLETLAGAEALNSLRSQGTLAMSLRHHPGQIRLQGGYSAVK